MSAGKGPGVRVPPPVPFIVGFLLAWLLERQLLHLGIAAPGPTRDAGLAAGGLFIALGLGLALWGLATLLKARTPVLPFRAATQMVVEGPYRMTRNPMYVGFSLVYAGLALVLNWWWPLLLLPLVLIALYRLAVRLEERHLQAAFGEGYAVYRARVRRWM